MKHSLTKVVTWGHDLLAEKIKKKQLAVDLTAGNGYDTLILYRLVGVEGQVIAFDIQPEALENTRRRLMEFGATVRMRQADGFPLPRIAGVDLVASGHENLQQFLPAEPQGIIANLGYLPGGDQRVITRPDSTCQALQQASEVLSPGGRLAVVVYPGHPGGAEEGDKVAKFFSGLCETSFQVLQMKVINRAEAPFLLVAEKQA